MPNNSFDYLSLTAQPQNSLALHRLPRLSLTALPYRTLPVLAPTNRSATALTNLSRTGHSLSILTSSANPCLSTPMIAGPIRSMPNHPKPNLPCQSAPHHCYQPLTDPCCQTIKYRNTHDRSRAHLSLTAQNIILW